MPRFRSKVVEIEAMQWNGTPMHALELIKELEAYQEIRYGTSGALTCHTLEGDMNVSPGDYVIKGLKGEFYPCKPDIFAMKYEAV